MSNEEMKENEQKPAHPHRLRKSARPRPITYVPMDEEEFAPFEPPVKKAQRFKDCRDCSRNAVCSSGNGLCWNHILLF